MAILSNPRFQAVDANGNPYSGGKLYTYVAGTTTEKAAYTDRDFTVEATNPVVLDSAGSATIYLNGSYKLILKDSDDNTVWTIDEVEGIPDTELDNLSNEIDVLEASVGALDDGTENDMAITSGSALVWKPNIAQLLYNYASTTLSPNDVVVTYPTANSAVVNTTTQGDTRPVLIAADTIAVAALGRFYYCGKATVAVTGAVARNDFLRTSATSKVAESAGAYPVYGVFGRALSANTSGVGTVTAWLFGYTFDDNLQNTHKFVRKTADEIVNNSTTLQNDDALVFTIGASEVWKFEVYLRVKSAAAADITVGWTVPSGATMSWGSTRYFLDVGTGSTPDTIRTESQSINCGTINITTECVIILRGVVINSTTAGSVQLQWAQTAATASDSTVMSNSYIDAWKIST